MIEVLRNYREEGARTLLKIETLDAGFIANAIAELTIRDKFKPVAQTALQRAKEILRAV